MTHRTENLTQALRILKQVRQTAGSQTVLKVAGEDRQRRLNSNLAAAERDLASILKAAELRNDPVSRMASGDESEEVLDAVVLYETK